MSAHKEETDMNREQWLDVAVKELTPLLAHAKAPSFKTPLVSVGFPRGGRGGNGKTIGQCWSEKCSGDKERSHIFLHPELTDSERVLDVLLHELVHSAVGTECGHRGEFRKVAVAVGLEGKMTATVAGEELKGRLNRIVKNIGTYPHPGLTAADRGKKGSRLVKVQCGSCGCIARMTRKWIEAPGPPTCGCGYEMEEA